MHRRAAIRAALASLVAVVALCSDTIEATAVTAAPTAAAPRTAPEPPPPPVTVNEFFPDEQNLGDCLGALERPGCGSKARGGWRQTAVFVVMAAGLAAVFGRVAYGVRRNRS